MNEVDKDWRGCLAGNSITKLFLISKFPTVLISRYPDIIETVVEGCANGDVMDFQVSSTV